MLHLIIELRYISAKIRKFTDVCMVGRTNLPCQKLKKKIRWKCLSPLLLNKIRQRERQKSNITVKSKSATLHGYHAYCAFLRCRDSPFVNGRCYFLDPFRNTLFLLKGKKIATQGQIRTSKPDSLLKTHFTFYHRRVVVA